MIQAMGRIISRAVLGVVVVTALVVPFAPDGADVTWVPPAVGIMSLLALVMGVRTHRMDRSLLWHVGRPEAWTLLGAGLGSIVMADIVRSLTSGATGPLYPSAGDAFMLPGYGAVAVGLI